MIGNDAFCPETGAPLSKRRHYDRQGQSYRAVVDDELGVSTPIEGELTNGAIRSSAAALARYFRRCHRRHYEPDGALYRRASLAIRRLKRTATGRQEADVYVWYALYHRLDRLGHATEWMHSYVEPRCPSCHGRLKYTEFVNGVSAQCGTNCDEHQTDRLEEIRDVIVSLYTAAFPDQGAEISIDDVLQF